MIALARQAIDRGAPMLNLLFHSSEAIVGTSPYNRNNSELQAFLDRLSKVLTFATRELNAEPMTFVEFRRRFAGAPAASRASA
jgi:hypothetical protein